MPEAQDEDCRGRDLVAHLVIADDDPADLARLIGFQLLAMFIFTYFFDNL